MRLPPHLPKLLCLLLACGATLPAFAQSGGLTREQMWYAPTAEDWQKPCLIQWQRTWEDALSVSEETGKPILVCVNMDGEIASEHYAGIRYRQPEKAKLYEPYVTVIASVYRHSPRDYDESGVRLPCPRFGDVTCGEHIAIETILYEKYFEGTRVAPRHIMIDLEGSENYDIYYALDTDSVFQAIEKGTEDWPEPFDPNWADRSLEDRLRSRDSRDRAAVEVAYRQGNRDLRQSLLRAVLQNQDAVPFDVVRLGLKDSDLEANRLARQALAQSTSTGAVSLISEALRTPMEIQERDALVDALERLGETSPQAKKLAIVHRGLAKRAEVIAVDDWLQELETADLPIPVQAWSELESRMDYSQQLSKSNPNDAEAQLKLAESSLTFAVNPGTAQVLAADRRTAGRYSRILFQEALDAAQLAEELGAKEWRTYAVQSIANYYLGNIDLAQAQAQAAVKDLSPGVTDWNAMAVLDIFAEYRRNTIAEAIRQKTDWPAGWLTELHAVYSVLARHPLSAEKQVLAHYDFLRGLDALGQASRVLREGLQRFPDSWELHGRLRTEILKDKGLKGLEQAYEDMLQAADAPQNMEWFAGYASFATAEFHRRRGQPSSALGAYDRAIEHYEKGIINNPATQDTADHYIALAYAGRARIAFQREDYSETLEELRKSVERKPRAAASLDGLGISAVQTAKMLQTRLMNQENYDGAAEIQNLLDYLEAIDPALLELPERDRSGPAPPWRQRRNGDRGRSRR